MPDRVVSIILFGCLCGACSSDPVSSNDAKTTPTPDATKPDNDAAAADSGDGPTLDGAVADASGNTYCVGEFAPEGIPGIDDSTRDYWKARLAALPPVNAEFTPAPELDTADCKGYRVRFDSHPAPLNFMDPTAGTQNVRLHGRYWHPNNTAAKVPAVLFQNGYNGTMDVQWTAAGGGKDAAGVCGAFGAAVMIYDYRGHGENADDPETENQFPKFRSDNFFTKFIVDGNAYWSNTGIVMDAYQAVEALLSRPEVCSSGVVLAGFSWGGGTSIMVPVLRSPPFGDRPGVYKSASGGPGPFGVKIAHLFEDALEQSQALRGVVAYIDEHPDQHAKVCATLYTGNAYHLVGALKGKTIQGWIGKQDGLYRGALATFEAIDKDANAVEIVVEENLAHSAKEWWAQLQPFMSKNLTCD